MLAYVRGLLSPSCCHVACSKLRHITAFSSLLLIHIDDIVVQAVWIVSTSDTHRGQHSNKTSLFRPRVNVRPTTVRLVIAVLIHIWTKMGRTVPSSSDDIKKLNSMIGQMMRHIYFGQTGFVNWFTYLADGVTRSAIAYWRLKDQTFREQQFRSWKNHVIS
jgi:hypothetical protein